MMFVPQASMGADGSKDVAPDNVLPADNDAEISWRGTRTGIAAAVLLRQVWQYLSLSAPCR